VVIKEEVDIKETVESEKDKVKLEPVMPEDLPIRRKRTAEMAGSYDWTSQLVEPGFCAAPVSCFKHVSAPSRGTLSCTVVQFICMFLA